MGSGEETSAGGLRAASRPVPLSRSCRVRSFADGTAGAPGRGLTGLNAVSRVHSAAVGAGRLTTRNARRMGLDGPPVRFSEPRIG